MNPASYGLENTANFYFPSMDKTYESERVGAWLIRQGYIIAMLDDALRKLYFCFMCPAVT